MKRVNWENISGIPVEIENVLEYSKSMFYYILFY
jgi:hypothetical protein